MFIASNESCQTISLLCSPSAGSTLAAASSLSLSLVHVSYLATHARLGPKRFVSVSSSSSQAKMGHHHHHHLLASAGTLQLSSRRRRRGQRGSGQVLAVHYQGRTEVLLLVLLKKRIAQVATEIAFAMPVWPSRHGDGSLSPTRASSSLSALEDKMRNVWSLERS